MSTAGRASDSGSVIMGWFSVADRETTASTACVSSREYGSAARIRCCALTIRDDAISSWARVILAIDLTALIRDRTARSCAPMALLAVRRGGRLVPHDGLLLVLFVAERGDYLFLGQAALPS